MPTAMSSHITPFVSTAQIGDLTPAIYLVIIFAFFGLAYFFIDLWYKKRRVRAAQGTVILLSTIIGFACSWLVIGFNLFVDLFFFCCGLIGVSVLVSSRDETTDTTADVHRKFVKVKDSERRTTYSQGRKNAWLCPDCKAINLNEERVCHQCNRLKPSSQTS
jgi:hypothetical protein